MENEATQDLAVDLLAFAATLPRGKLKGSIAAFRDMHSAHSDLVVAVDFVSGLRAFQNAAAIGGRNAIVEDAAFSFLCSAIVMYARATKSESNHRKTYDFRGWFDEEAKRAHQIIVDLRDDAVAHYGPGGSFGGQHWQSERVFLAPPNGQVLAISSRLVISPQLIELLEAHTQRAVVIAEREVRERETAMMNILSRAMQSDAQLSATLRSFGVDMAEAMGDRHAVEDLLRGPRSGKRRMFSRYASS